MPSQVLASEFVHFFFLFLRGEWAVALSQFIFEFLVESQEILEQNENKAIETFLNFLVVVIGRPDSSINEWEFLMKLAIGADVVFDGA